MRSGSPACQAVAWVTGIKSEPGLLPLLPGTKKTAASVATACPWGSILGEGMDFWVLPVRLLQSDLMLVPFSLCLSVLLSVRTFFPRQHLTNVAPAVLEPLCSPGCPEIQICLPVPPVL